jgi:D-glycero-alpha-D-manno-heptose-7-phosphate kinase
VLSATINRYVHGSLWPRDDGRVRVESLDLGVAVDFAVGDPVPFDGRLDLAKAAVRRIGRAGTGCRIVLRSGVPPGSGLGSSSSTMVALVGLLREHCGLALSEHDTARLAHLIEREDLGIPGGLQDHYAATFGGFNVIEFGERVVVHPLPIRDAVVKELQDSLLLCFTGVTRESAAIIADQTARLESRQDRTLAGLRAQKELVREMRTALSAGALDRFGDLLGAAWEQKKKLSPLIATPRIDEAYDLAIRNGARGGKVTGAGGGGFLLLYCAAARQHRVHAALTRFGVSVTNVCFEKAGLTTWRA